LPTKYKSKKAAEIKEKTLIKQIGSLNGTHNPIPNPCFAPIAYEPEDMRLILTMKQAGFKQHQIIRVIERKFPNFTRIDLNHIIHNYNKAQKKLQKLQEAQ